MKVLYAVFHDKPSADGAVRDVREAPECSADRCEVVQHDKALDLDRVFDAQRLAVEETDTMPAQVRGLLLGGLAGAVLAVLLRWALAMTQFSIWVTIAFGAVAGMLLGGLAAGLVGAAMPDRQLRKLKSDLNRGSVLVTFSVSGVEAEQAVQRVLRRRGVRGVQHKHVV